ncbi:hypothetical protein [Membranihabitans marinus]|uniref:hypothetical protein n=1 Tax=Membranihabitans marinus TaxID=1227546 RepID=UPI001F45A22F|nr:hypothetical protein [Membranihabitans marinus]
MQEDAINYLIYGVKNLTDARYFTAMGVEYLHFELNPKSNFAISEKDFHEIIAWVEGPKILCSFDHLFDEDQIKSLIQSPHIQGMVSQFPDLLDFCASVTPLETFLQIQDTNNISPVADKYKTIAPNSHPELDHPYILCDTVNIAINRLKDNVKHIGLIAGDESEVGIKDFEEFDDLFYQNFAE